MTKIPEVITADFETKGIQPRPKYPPKPSSLALYWPNGKYDLMSWGHPTGNNCTEKEARGRLKTAYDSKYPILFQNGMFDQDVAEEHWELPLLDWRKWHDTLFLIFLYDPHADSLSLKPAAERILKIKPEEQDKMYDWIIKNIPAAKQRPSEAGAYIADCPYSIVKPYHKGDLDRTFKIFRKLYPLIVEYGMLPAYQRELKLMPILLRNARVGMQLDVERLGNDLPGMKRGVERADEWLMKRLGIDNIDSDRQLGEALYSKGIVTEVTRTKKTGAISISKKYMTLDRFKDKKVWQVLQYRSKMATSINMFGDPWMELAAASADGHTIHPSWSQVRSPKGDSRDTKGARSGRIICAKPNFLNIPKKWKRAITQGYVHPMFLKVPELPFMRVYCLPDKGDEWGRRDFNQQELRLFGEYEEGPVMEGFLTDPDFDIHEDVRAEAEARLIAAALREAFDRDSAKTCVFGRLYGQGIPGLMESLQLREEEKPVAQIIQKAINTAVPSIKALDEELKKLAKQGLPICTWGGRLYYCEEPKYSEKYGRDMTFEYKLLNYLLQGSGADVTKETLIRYDEAPKRKGRLIVTVYDEINFGAKPKAIPGEHKVLQDCMRSIETTIPMLSDGERGPSWGELTKVKA